MPTENRSSNTETISVPRELTPEMREAFHNSYEAYEDGQGECPDSQWQAMLRVAPKPAPQPHPDPIAWMVGTAFWWTKEEAERDAAATGLAIVGLGPMTDSGEVDQLREVIKHSDDQIMRQSLRISNQRAQLAERDSLLDRVVDHAKFWHDHPYAEVVEGIAKDYKALSASAEPQVKS